MTDDTRDNSENTEQQAPAAGDAGGRPRRARVRPEPEMPSGYRSTRRGSRAAKDAKKAKRQHTVLTKLDRTGRGAKNVGWLVAYVVGGLALAALVMWGAAAGVNSLARWNAERGAAGSDAEAVQAEKAKGNVLLIATEDGKAAGFLAVRVDREVRRVFGVALPEGAFIEVPGQGFEPLGDSLAAGPDVSVDAVSNFLAVPFREWVIIPAEAYRTALTEQDMSAVLDQVDDTNITPGDLESLSAFLGKVPTKDVALVPLPVKPIKLGDQTYFEPQRAEVADLLKSWWGVNPDDVDKVTRVIVYNGAGVPGIAGVAAQALIRNGLRVVDTKNADNFNYKQTQIVVQNGDESAGATVRRVLGAGTVLDRPTDQDVADVIVIIGKDYKPPTGGN